MKIESINDQNERLNQVPIKARLLINPIRQYALFGKVPLSLVFHLLVIFNTVQFLSTISQPIIDLMRPTKMFFYTKFIDDGIVRDDIAMNT